MMDSVKSDFETAGPAKEETAGKQNAAHSHKYERGGSRKEGFRKIPLQTVFLYALFCLLLILTINNKANFHLDELCSYGLANYQGGVYMIVEDGKKYEHSAEPFLEFLTVDKDHRFDYANVWKNQAADVHPPLYYSILHTICSLFPGTFTKWYAGSINIVSALLALLVLRKLCDELTNSNKTVKALTSVSFVLLSGILAEAAFLRMYILAMFLMSYLTLVLIREIGRWNYHPSYYVKVFFIVLAGALTHYYCIIYSVFLVAAVCVFLIIMKKWKPVVGFAVTGGAAGLSACLIFPAMLTHMFSGYRGSEAIENLGQTPRRFWSRLKEFYNIADKELWGHALGYIAAFTAFLFILYCIGEERDGPLNIRAKFLGALDEDAAAAKVMAWRFAVIACAVIPDFLFVAKSATYKSGRYLTPVYGVAFFASMSFVLLFCRNILKGRTAFLAGALLMSVVTVGAWRNADWSKLFSSSVPLLNKAAAHSGVDCLYIYDKCWKITPSFCEVRHYKSVTFLSTDHLDELKDLEIASDDRLMVVTMMGEKKTVRCVEENCPQLNSYKSTGKFSYAKTYSFHSE